VSIDYTTRDGTAIVTKDYHRTAGTAVFEDGESEQTIRVSIINDEVYENDEVFYFVISNPAGGAGIGRVYEATITIVNDDVMSSKLDALKSVLRINEDRVNQVATKWIEQFEEALERPDDGLLSIAGFLWMLMLPWSLLLAFLPPPTIGGGWLLFVVSLSCTGLVTALIGDYAALLGCTIGLSDYVTAITLVALGTSLPDTFASVLAAKTDRHADAAIINVTGSNSVNVFLGLGVAWLIGAIYWEGNATDAWRIAIACKDPSVVKSYPNGAFFVKAGSISFSVAVYAVCATASLVYMNLNRRLFGGELGGPKRIIFLVIQIMFWGIYITLSSLKSEGVF
jgi:solute carrier family 8 (sodium/calcium exchanger)